MKSRCLRIFPALLVVIICTVFILGPLITYLPIDQYFKDVETYKYLLSIFLFPVQYNLPGVFTDNVYANIVNGSLWTLKVEFLCYIAVLIAGLLNLLNKKIIFIAFIVTLIVPYAHISAGEQYTDLFRFFCAGILIYLYKEKLKLNPLYFYLSLTIIFISLFWNFNTWFAIFGSYILIYLSYCKKIKLHNWAKYGDFSYGMYIFAFPIQQIVMLLFNNKLLPIWNFLITFPVAILLSYVSWHLVEKQSLKLKNKMFSNGKYVKNRTISL